MCTSTVVRGLTQPSPEGRDPQRSSGLAGAGSLSKGLQHAGAPKRCSHHKRGFMALNLRLFYGTPWTRSVSPAIPWEARVRGALPGKDPCQRWITSFCRNPVSWRGLQSWCGCSGLGTVNLSQSLHPFLPPSLFHITVSTFGSRGFEPRISPLKHVIPFSTICQIPLLLIGQLCPNWEH